MDNHCITCRWCDHSEGHVCTLGILPIDDPYSDRCESYTAETEPPHITGVDKEYRLCSVCQKSVDYDDMLWRDGEFICPSCYFRVRAEADAQGRGDL